MTGNCLKAYKLFLFFLEITKAMKLNGNLIYSNICSIMFSLQCNNLAKKNIDNPSGFSFYWAFRFPTLEYLLVSLLNC